MSTTPDLDLATAAVNRLLASDVFAELVSDGFIGQDEDGTPWVFQGLDNDGRPFRDPEGSGVACIVVNENKHHDQSRWHTFQFPELQILIYVDSTRNADGSTITQDARRKCKHIAKRVNSLFHLPGNTEADQDWEGFRVHGSIGFSALILEDIPGTQATAVRGQMSYETKVD